MPDPVTPLVSGCVFCRIVAGEAAASLVLEGDRVVAFLDHAPVTPGHLLVVPRRHAVGLADLDPEDGREMMAVAQLINARLRASGVPCQGVNLFLADGEVAGQEVFHAHLHVIPRTRGDGFGIRVPARARPSRVTLDEVAAAIRGALAG